MSNQPSLKVGALINTIKTEPLSQDDIIEYLSIMMGNFQKDEAKAYRCVQGVLKYYGVKNINALTGQAE